MSSDHQASSLSNKVLDLLGVSITVDRSHVNTQAFSEVCALTCKPRLAENRERTFFHNTYDSVPALIQPANGVAPEVGQVL